MTHFNTYPGSPESTTPLEGTQVPDARPSSLQPALGEGDRGTVDPANKTDRQRGGKYRVIFATLIFVAIVVVWFVSNPGGAPASSSTDWSTKISAAEFSNNLNNANTKGAPQQQVVNGWHTNDLLTIQVEQNTALIEGSDHRTRVQDRNGKVLALLALGLVGDAIFRSGTELKIRRRLQSGNDQSSKS